MALYRLVDPEPDRPLRSPALVAAFDGWVDAAGASTAAASHIAQGARQLAAFDPDALYDYRARRPVLDIVDGVPTKLAWSELSMRWSAEEHRDLLILSGPEPDFRWRELAGDVLELCRRFGVTRWVSLGSIPAALPHTRPVPVMATASRPGLLQHGEQQGPPGLLRVPSAMLSTLEIAVSAGGLPAVGYFAQVPHYVSGPYAAGSIALLDHLSRHLEVEIPLGQLPDEAMAQRERLDDAIGQDSDSKSYIERLEALADEERLPTGDDLAAEVERFLRDAGRGESGPGSGPTGPLPS
ncbi:MAG TPA: PAC2 family protein [Actinomycetota bacterium]|nr:PAC2 family protein [Actinomycetota bacterium]